MSTIYATGAPGTLVQTGLNQSYAYDSFGNILQNGSFNTSYTANNQMFGYSYDAAGNLLSDGMNIMTWDAESRMATVGGATYIYDAEGNRVEKQGSSVVDTVYFGGQPIARYSAGQWTDLIYGPTGLLAEVPGTQTGAPVYRVTDNLGTNVGSLLADGTFVDPLDHTPFGQVFTGNTSDPYLFTGKERDTESGLDYFGARYYSSNMGRFSSPDPLGNFVADPSDPQSWNQYAYARNNPLRFIDPDGYDYCQWDDGTHDDTAENGGATNQQCYEQGGTIVLQVQAKPPAADNSIDLLTGNTSGMISGNPSGPMLALAGAGFMRQLNPSNQECQALAKKIDNIVDQISKRTDAIARNPLNLPQSAPGPLRGSIDGHQQLLQGYINDLGAAADLYNQKCGGGQPGSSGSPSPAGSASPSSSSLKRAMVPIAVTVGVGAGVVGTAILCPECLVLAPLLAVP